MLLSSFYKANRHRRQGLATLRLWIKWTTTVAPKPVGWRHVPLSYGTRKRGITIMTVHFLPPYSDAYEAAVNDAIATCNGDLRGALKALIIANEFLERDLQAAASTSGLFSRE